MDFSTLKLLIYYISDIKSKRKEEALYVLFDGFGDFTTILGWSCLSYCQIIDCKLFNLWAVTSHYSNGFSGDCPSRAIDTSTTTINVISQSFMAQAGEHYLDIKFLLPITYESQKILVIMINGKIILKYGQTMPEFNHKTISIKITLRGGFNNFTMTGEGKNDADGFRVFDVKMRRIIIPQVDNLIDMATSNIFLSNLVAIPGSRVIFGELLNALISFDRMQLYYYHHRSYSYYYDRFIKGIVDLLNQKGIYATYSSDVFFSSIGTSEQSIRNIIDYKAGRKYKDGYDKNSFVQNGGLFFIVSSVPMTLIIFFTLYGLFRLTYKNKQSKLLRKYSFFSLILLMFFEGNIEQFTFLIIDQFLEYFSASFAHKVINIVVSMIFYLIVFCSTAFYLYCWQIHKKNVSYLTDNVSLKMSGMIAYTFDRGLMCLMLGSAHRLTLLYGIEQLLILAAVQTLLIIPKIIFLLCTSYKCKKLGWMSVIEGLTRICFQISIFLYEDAGDDGSFINQEIHLKIIYVFLFIWTLNLTLYFIELVKQSVSQKKPKCQSKSIKPVKILTQVKKSSIDLYKDKIQTKQQKDKGFRIRIMGKINSLAIQRKESA